MSEIASQLQVNVPPDKVFAYLCDVGNHSEWAEQRLEVSRVDSGPVVVGSKWETVGHLFGKQAGTVTITELIPNQRIVFESDGDAGLFRHSFQLEPSQGDSLLLVKTMDPVEIRSLPLKLLRPLLLGYLAPRGLKGDLARIKAKLESS